MSAKGMILLDYENKILHEILCKRIGAKSQRPTEQMDLRLCDFDDVQYNLTIEGNTLQLSIAYAPLKELQRFGAKALVSSWANITVAATKSNYDMTFQVDLELVTPDKSNEVIEILANLKRNLFGAPFDQCFKALSDGTSNSLSPIQIKYRKNETVFIQPQEDRIVIVYNICFESKTDQAIVRVFLQEFAEARRHVNNAPPVSFGRDPPLELRGVPGLQPSDDLVGYISFAIFQSHVDTDARRQNAVSLVQGFRNYLHYHVKCSKSYLHSRMRERVELSLQVLNRAQPEKDPSKSSKKTITGKTFTRS